MEIRECQIKDYYRIQVINKESFAYDYDLEKTKERITAILQRSTDKIYVACINDVVVGYIHACDYECTYSDSLKNIMAIAVEPQYQGMKIGKQLLLAVENWAKKCKCSGVRLVSGFNRTKAHGFYMHCGYRERKQQKNFIKRFIDNE